jgi:5'-3' exonuclease
MKTRTLIVDSNYLLKRSLSGAKNVYTSVYGHIGGLYGFTTQLRYLIKEYKVNRVILAWDGQNGGKLRYNLLNTYKSTRKNKQWYTKIELSEAEILREQDKEESALKQKKRIQSYAEELFIRQIEEIDEIEADDLIAAYCLKHHEIEDIIIYTKDRDYSMLLSLNIKIKFDDINELIDKSNYYFNFGITHKNALTVKIICGDTSDNIKGIEGIQLDTLLKLFPEIEFRYMSVKEICIRAKEINEERVKKKMKPLKCLENLLNNKERLILNHKLMNLHEPFLNEEAIEALEQLDCPLSDENRGSKNLYKMMIEDEFLSVYNGNFVNYVEPFYTVIAYEQQLLKEYYKAVKNNIT